MEFVQFLMIENKCGFSLHTHTNVAQQENISRNRQDEPVFNNTSMQKEKNVKRKMMPSRFQPI